MLDIRFPTAVQMVLCIAQAEREGKRSTSKILAASLEANPSFVRKMMVPLSRDGIIVSTLGRTGTIRLGRSADQITLCDIYMSVLEDKPLLAGRPEVSPRCLVSANSCWFFKELAQEAEQATMDVLSGRTVADALKEIGERDQRHTLNVRS
ncbi:RrF2 family transcriptional regulator [Erwinia psidii]|uniref:Rrf2 family transcriptional regulator n=1 Tax=Erwinia psidii TaxID=69224 RepID=A0A3N6V105_9GAMM|nr:Rrf2 family transcriptional regulator [Erwinia psidii]MCX8956038.1 Rrf2 family transcriptional regulator [Erwinia psidii]MCX8961412.1 Rrf2 family transcriptional regulator [Erwinia psidii]MCX8963742.1 Rrf2 family transcriptional regulator [Erwinia psidii]RQM38745.1 Rrf2 family transcriptional regulator [Erwinia psidii]